MSEEVRIDLVSDVDAGELLTVRRAAFVAEAQLYGDPNLPALTQTLSELQEDLQRPDVVTIGAWDGPRLIGSEIGRASCRARVPSSAAHGSAYADPGA